MERIELELRVDGISDLPGSHSIAVTVCLPDGDTADPPVIVFCYPGAGYGRRYFDIRDNRFDGYSQAEHHVAKGFVVVTVDHPGTGESGEVDRTRVSYENVAAIHHALVVDLTRRLQQGLPGRVTRPLQSSPVVIGVGHSYGGILLSVLQGRLKTFDGVAMLGYSPTGAEVPSPAPASTSLAGKVLAADRLSPSELRQFGHLWEDTPPALVQWEEAVAAAVDPSTEDPDVLSGSPLPPCASSRRVGGPHWAPRASEPMRRWAAVIECPVFLGFGARDYCPDPWAAPGAYRGSNDVTVAVTPRMAHLHNFASTRMLLWERLAHWITGVAAIRMLHPDPPSGHGRVSGYPDHM